MTSRPMIAPDDAVTTLAGIRSTRDRTRGDLRTYWFACVVFGALTLLSAPFFSIADGAAVGLFWLVGAPVGVFAVIRHARVHERSGGVARPARPYMITSGCLVAGCFALGFGGGFAGEAAVAAYGPPLVVALAYAVFAYLERSIGLACLSVSLAALTIALAVADPSNGGQLLAIAYGASFVILGLLARTWTTTAR